MHCLPTVWVIQPGICHQGQQIWAYFLAGDKVKVASHHPYLAFQPKNMQSVSQGASRAAELNVVLMPDPSLQQRANVPDLFPSSGSSSGENVHLLSWCLSFNTLCSGCKPSNAIHCQQTQLIPAYDVNS